MAKKMSTDCINKGLKAYVVTGVVPGNTKLKNRVLIPSHYWTAFCCLDNNNKPKLSLGWSSVNWVSGDRSPERSDELPKKLRVCTRLRIRFHR
ncbi:hypothetical protein HF521_013142 [Silurus meridionalis]|uniref:Uncharacterized protein n=1 Tax=Silurus meridionalis TaxID=175797 RepID=A0A8T0AEQ1_SILME|nr:hypothetical protein HF521_013142 [Silurus meridionalis]